MNEDLPRLYRDLASWWPLLSAPEDYAEEAEDYRSVLAGAVRGELREVLELGSGGGNNASHLKRHFSLTLVDRSPDMLAVSRRLNPECQHLEGDMRTIRLARTFDALFVHDAVAYLTTEDDRTQRSRPRSSTRVRAARRCSSPIRSARPSSRPRTRAATTVPTAP